MKETGDGFLQSVIAEDGASFEAETFHKNICLRRRSDAKVWRKRWEHGPNLKRGDPQLEGSIWCGLERWDAGNKHKLFAGKQRQRVVCFWLLGIRLRQFLRPQGQQVREASQKACNAFATRIMSQLSHIRERTYQVELPTASF